MNGVENKKQLPLVAVCGNKKDEEKQEKKHESEKQRIVYSEIIK